MKSKILNLTKGLMVTFFVAIFHSHVCSEHDSKRYCY